MFDAITDPVATSTSSLCSGLSLLLSYNSSSENSAENSPQQSHSTSSGSAFDFNLGLLAQVAVKLSPDKKKDAEIKNNEKQSHLLQDSATTESTLESKMTSNKSQQDNTKETNLSSTKTLSVGKDKPTCTVTESESTHEDETKADRETTLLSWFKKAEENDKSKSFVSSNEVVTSSTGESTCFGVTMETRDQSQLDLPISTEEYPAPHSFLCNGRLLRLHEPHHPGNQDAFAKRWIEGKVVDGSAISYYYLISILPQRLFTHCAANVAISHIWYLFCFSLFSLVISTSCWIKIFGRQNPLKKSSVSVANLTRLLQLCHRLGLVIVQSSHRCHCNLYHAISLQCHCLRAATHMCALRL